MNRSLAIVTALVAILFVAACNDGKPIREERLGPSTASAAGLPRLVFFKNPNGRPCQIQQGVLDSLARDLVGKVQLVTYQTTSAADLSKFEEYGIRSLPILMVTDASGRELRRATPGIQGPEQVMALIRN